MKKAFKVFLSLFLCLAVSAVPLSCAAGEGLPAAERDCPLITVRGFMASHILADASDPESEQLWPPSTGKILSAVKGCIPGLLKYIFLRSDSLLCEELAEHALPILTDLSLNPDGTAPGKSGVNFTYPSPDSVTPQSKYDYFYDWRLDPVEEAARFNEFVNYIADCSGCGEVVIHCYSYGSTFTAAYAALYGTEKVKTFVFNSVALFGVNSVGEVLKGNVEFDPDALIDYLDCLLNGNKLEFLVDSLVKILGFTGAVRRLCGLAGKLFENYGNDIVSVFSGWPSVWAMVPDSAFDEAQRRVFGSVFADGTDRSGLSTKIEGYNAAVKANRENILEDINESCNFYVISRYGSCSIFLTPSWKMNGDTVIDVACTSFGAKAADFGNTLPEGEPAADSGFISPDKAINAASCLFPEQTWFVRGVTHTGSLGNFNKMVDLMLASGEQITVDTYEELPRFFGYDRHEKAVTANR